MFASPIGVRQVAEVNAQMNTAAEAIDRGQSAYPGKTYEEGVRDALMWVTDEDDEPPLPADD